MENKDLTRGTLVTYEGAPFVVVRPDSDQMVELFPGDELKHDQEMRNACRWVYSSGVRPREVQEPEVDRALEAVVATFRVQIEYHTDMHGLNSAEVRTLESVTHMLANKLYGAGTPERASFLGRIVGGK